VAASPSVLVVVSEDPRVSHRASEGLRIALGVAASDIEVVLVLSGPAAHLLDADTDDLVDGDDIARVRGSLRTMGVRFHVAEDTIPTDPDWNADGHAVTPVSPGDVAALLERTTRSIVF
jgi:predicted peroxiredoxin